MSLNEIDRGREALRLMEEPLIKEAFDTIESGLIDSMYRCPMADTATQHELVLTLQLLGKFKGMFQEIMETGKLAQIQEESMSNRLVKRLKGL